LRAFLFWSIAGLAGAKAHLPNQLPWYSYRKLKKF